MVSQICLLLFIVYLSGVGVPASLRRCGTVLCVYMRIGPKKVPLHVSVVSELYSLHTQNNSITPQLDMALGLIRNGALCLCTI